MVLEQFIIDADIIWDQVGKTFFENPEAKPGRIMRVQVVNAGIIEDLTGYTLNLGWTSVRDPSKFGLDAFDDVDITKGIFEIEYTSGMLTNIGPLNASLQLVPPGEGRPIESNNFKLTVKNSAINPEAIQGETSFKALENALVEVNGWNATIDGKVVAWEADMAATKQLYIDNMEEVERTYPQELVSLSQLLEQAATKTELQAVASGSPKGVYDTLSALQSAKPTGDANIYVVTADGKWYYWSGSAWTAGGTYQSTGIADGSVTYNKVDGSISTKFINLEAIKPLSVSGGTVSKNLNEYVYTPTTSSFYAAFFNLNTHVSVGDKLVVAFDVKSSNLPPDRRVRLRVINGGIDVLTMYYIGRDYARYFYVLDINEAVANNATHLALSWYTPVANDNFCLNNIMLINTGKKYTIEELNKIDWTNIPYAYSVDIDTVLKKYLSNLENAVASISSKTTMAFKPPVKFDFVAGEKVELFDRGLIHSDLTKDEFFTEITLPSGSSLKNPEQKMHKNLLDFTGVSETTSSNLYFWIRDIYGNQLTTSDSMLYKSVPFTVNAIPPNPSSMKNILFCGDSLMSTGLITQKFIQKMTGYGLTNLKLVGRRFHTTVENRFEGLGGWAWRNYVDDPATLPSGYPDNYFWDSSIGDINITKYMQTYASGDNLDYIVCELGMNHLVNSTNQGSDLTVVSTKVKHFIDRVHEDYPNAKVLLVGVHRFSDMYKYNQKKNRDFPFDLNNTYEAIATDSKYSSFVKFANVSSMFDSKYGSNFFTQSAGLFAGDETEEYLIDYVHPNDNGYQMYADCISRKFITMI